MSTQPSRDRAAWSPARQLVAWRALSVFADIPVASLLEVGAAATLAHYEPGALLGRGHRERRATVELILEGYVRSGTRVWGPNEIAGGLPAWGTKRLGELTALERVVTMAVATDEFVGIVASDPRLLDAALGAVAQAAVETSPASPRPTVAHLVSASEMALAKLTCLARDPLLGVLPLDGLARLADDMEEIPLPASPAAQREDRIVAHLQLREVPSTAADTMTTSEPRASGRLYGALEVLARRRVDLSAAPDGSRCRAFALTRAALLDALAFAPEAGASLIQKMADAIVTPSIAVD
ncbi:MAG: hypothetical protein AAGN82_30880 [Myxococcota bacterium]